MGPAIAIDPVVMLAGRVAARLREQRHATSGRLETVVDDRSKIEKRYRDDAGSGTMRAGGPRCDWTRRHPSGLMHSLRRVGAIASPPEPPRRRSGDAARDPAHPASTARPPDSASADAGRSGRAAAIGVPRQRRVDRGRVLPGRHSHPQRAKGALTTQHCCFPPVLV